MLISGSRLLNAPIMSLQTGGELARTARAVIDPSTLEIIAYEVEGPLLDQAPSLIRIADVREFSDIGLIVDSSSEFVTIGDIIHIDKIYALHFDPIGMRVIDKKKRKLGKVVGYTIETSGFVIQQLSIKRPLLKSLTDTELLVHRTQIVEINDSTIIVEQHEKAPKPVAKATRTAYANPFRKESPQSGHIEQR